MNLRDLVNEQQLSRMEAFDILTSLAILIENGAYSGISPENIEVKSDYEVEIKDPSVCDNAYFLAPEQLFYGEKAGKNSAYFSFGMIYYYVLSSKIWYVAQSVKVYEIENREIRIVDPGSPFADINKMVSNIPEERIKGFDAFFQQAQTLAGENTFEIRLQIDNDTENRIPLFGLEGSKEAVHHPISLGRIRRISFWKIKVDSHGRVKGEKQLREVLMPRVKQEALICINYDSVHSKATVSLLNKNKSHRIVPKALSFNTDIE